MTTLSTSSTRPTRRSDEPDGVRLLASARAVLERPLTPYYLVLGASVLLTTLGLVMVLSASSVESYVVNGSSWTVVQRQAVWVAVGIPVLIVASRLPVRAFRMMAIPALVLSLVLLVLVLIPGIGISVNGNQNWIDLPGHFRVQPAEAAKLALVLWGSDLLVRKRRLLTQYRHLTVPLLPASAVVIGLVLLGGDLGTSLILMTIVAGLLFVAGAPMRLFALLGGFSLAVVLFMTFERSARLSRLQTFLDPFADYQGAGWQGAHSLFALASGGWWGVGLGASREKWGALPEAHTDFIFAVIGEELGLVGTVTVLLVFGALLLGAVRIALLTDDLFVRFASAGIVVWLGVQMVINIGGVVGVLPITGVPLPLVSYGGSALLATMFALGMLLSFARKLPGARTVLAQRAPSRWRRFVSEASTR
ncbi:MAG TPA: putative lipid II flippase FtsW [Actinomycetes bacterium]|nr:putative lipid II flippase FtsW [Actinomycetes bacterium]